MQGDATVLATTSKGHLCLCAVRSRNSVCLVHVLGGLRPAHSHPSIVSIRLPPLPVPARAAPARPLLCPAPTSTSLFCYTQSGVKQSRGSLLGGGLAAQAPRLRTEQNGTAPNNAYTTTALLATTRQQQQPVPVLALAAVAALPHATTEPPTAPTARPTTCVRYVSSSPAGL